MKRFLLDTGILSDFINHRRGVDIRVREAQRKGGRIGTSLSVVGELFAGVEASDTRERNLKCLVAGLSRIICWPFDRAAAETYGILYATLKRQGKLIQQVDLQSAAIALNLDCTVVTKDSDFGFVPSLTTENWAALAE